MTAINLRQRIKWNSIHRNVTMRLVLCKHIEHLALTCRFRFAFCCCNFASHYLISSLLVLAVSTKSLPYCVSCSPVEEVTVTELGWVSGESAFYD